MRVTANGYSRNVVGSHTLTDKVLDDAAIIPTAEGVELYVRRSNSLALSGHFHLHIHLSIAELRQALHTATIKRLEKRIDELEAKLS
jgi:hypothetical protein